MSNKSIAPIKAAPVWMSGATAESGSEERSLLTRQKNLFSSAAKQKKTPNKIKTLEGINIL